MLKARFWFRVGYRSEIVDVEVEPGYDDAEVIAWVALRKLRRVSPFGRPTVITGRYLPHGA